MGGETTRVENRGETTREETTRGETSWVRNVLLPAAVAWVCFLPSCRTATLDFFFDLAESKVAVFLCSILTSDGVPFCFGKNLFP